MHNGIDVLVTGFVPNLTDVYAKATLAVAPLRFVVGVQNKILEAMALGTPVVSTTMGNGGIKATNGKEIVLADNSADFAKAVVDLLNDDEKEIISQKMAKNT